MQTVLILGRQPALGLAELESLYGAAAVRAVGDNAALLDIDPAQVDFHRLGGSVKAARLLTTLDTIDWRRVERQLIDTTPEHAALLPDGKLTIGLSSYGFPISAGQLNALGLSIKKAIRKTAGRSVRLVPNNDTELSSAQIYHNHLTGERAWELVLLRDGDNTLLAQTFAVQDIDSYTVRDRGRPKRDARVGMLPPKLAQIIINLAAGQIPISDVGFPMSEQLDRKSNVERRTSILDPFCGTGVLLQEAQLMGYDVYGTDLEQRMIDYSRTNLTWLKANFQLPDSSFNLEPGDATGHQWNPKPDAVAAETYLGKPFTALPDPATLAKTVSEVDLILRKFLKNIHAQLKPGTRLCLAVPAWNLQPINDSRLRINGRRNATDHASAPVTVNRQSSIANHFRRLPLIDSLERMGYNQIRFEHVQGDQLLYYREDQIVARQLLVLQTINE